MLKQVKSFCLLFQVMPLLFFASCTKNGTGGAGLSVLPDTESFAQNESTFKKKKIDILWVIDNSRSMLTHQQSLQKSFSSFINRFSKSNYDFQMAVATTDAYEGGSKANWFIGDESFTMGIMTPETDNLIDTFSKNTSVGISGAANEKPFDSFKVALENENNAEFYREDSFLSIIILTNEKDSSEEELSHYLQFLNEFTGSKGIGENYSISLIAYIKGVSTCREKTTDLARKERRYANPLLLEGVTETSGIQVDVCTRNYNKHLTSISQNIIELSTIFKLKRVPFVSSIQVKVEDNLAPRDRIDGWHYSKRKNSILFHGSYVPEEGDKIQVDYTPEFIEL